MTSVGKNMEMIRKAAGLSRKTVGEWFDLSEHSIRHMESGKGSIPADRLLIIADRLGIPINSFFDTEEARKAVGVILTRKYMSGVAEAGV